MSIVEKTGKTVDEALQEALAELNLTREQVDVEIIDEPKKAILGIIGGRKAKVRVTSKEVAPVVTPAPAAAVHRPADDHRPGRAGCGAVRRDLNRK